MRNRAIALSVFVFVMFLANSPASAQALVCGDEDSFRHIVGEIVKESAKKAAEECLKNPDSCRRIVSGDGQNSGR